MGERSTAGTICGMRLVEVKNKMHKKRSTCFSISRIKLEIHKNRGTDDKSRVGVLFTN